MEIIKNNYVPVTLDTVLECVCRNCNSVLSYRKKETESRWTRSNKPHKDFDLYEGLDCPCCGSFIKLKYLDKSIRV